MTYSDLKVSLRHISHNKLYSTINVVGLAIGISCVLLSVLYWKDERSYDNFHQNNPNLYRITTTMAQHKGSMVQTGGTGQVQGPAFRASVPEIKDYVRIMGGGIYGDVLTNNNMLHMQLLFADDHFFSVFSFPLLRGNPQTALKDINSVVITESAAMRLFRSTDVIGRELQLDADPSAKRLGKPMVISAVAKDIPANSSIQFELLLSMPFMQLSFDDKNWLNAYLSTFIVLHPEANKNAVLEKFHQIYAMNAKDALVENIKTYGFDPSISYGLQPITDIHLNPLDMDMEIGVVQGSNPVFSYLFAGIAFFILLMAGINFVNISIADSLKRAKEVGVRKISGGSSLQIIMLFLSESAVLCLISFLLAIGISWLILPAFNFLAGKHMLIITALSWSLCLDFGLILLTIILFTGFYPAWILSRMNARDVLYSRQKLTGRNWFGKSLVVLQFSLAVFLLIATLVYQSQMNYVRTKDLGYDPHQVLQAQIPGDRTMPQIYRLLRAELSGEPSVASVSFGGGENAYPVESSHGKTEAIYKVIDEEFLKTMNIPIKLGRNLSAAIPSDSNNAVIVNEAFVKAARLEHPIGEWLKTDPYFDKEPKTIIGVIRDYHVGSLREPIKPMVLFMNKWYGGNILVKLDQLHQKEGMAAAERAFKKVIPQAVAQWHFLDELNAKQYEQEQRWQQIIGMATLLSIAICCLGLFGLAHLATQQRVKEIGIRKVLGASLAQIVALLSGSFLKLVMLAILIAAPVAWLIMNRWLRDFAYRITIGPGFFIGAGLISIAVAMGAVSVQAIKAANTNPVTSLRAE